MLTSTVVKVLTFKFTKNNDLVLCSFLNSIVVTCV